MDIGLRERVSFDSNEKILTISGILTTSERDALEKCFKGDEAREVVRRLYMASHGLLIAFDWVVPSIDIPALSIRVGEQLELLEENHFLDMQWNLATCDPVLKESDFPSEVSLANEAEVDVSSTGKIETRLIPQVRTQLALLRVEGDWSVSGLANWIDRQIEHPDITRTMAILFIQKAIEKLAETRHLKINQLALEKFRLRDAINALIERHRGQMRKDGYQKVLFGSPVTNIEVSPEVCLVISQDRYAPNWYYEGGYKFQKHALPVIGELKSEGEEFDCACYIDQLPQVRRWVRNLERRPTGSFWLPTSTDRFYPDFVVHLENGQFLVVEYKGEHLWSNDDSKEKRAVGELWADRSSGRGIFVMPKGRQYTAIADAISRNTGG